MKFLQKMDEEQKKLPEDEEKNRDVAAFSYTLFFSPLLLVTRKDSKFILFHARQAFILFLFFVVFWAIGGFFRYMNIFVLVAAVLGFLRAMAGEWYEIPMVSDLVKNGFSPALLWEKMKLAGKFLIHVFEGFFSKTERDSFASKISHSSADKTELEERIGEIERLFFTEKYFYKGLPTNLSDSLQKKCSDFESSLLARFSDTHTQKQETMTTYTGSFGKVIVGGYSSTGFLIGFSKKTFPDAKADFFLGNFMAISITESTKEIDLL